MRRIVFSAAVSLDGYIAGPNGEADWIVMDPEFDFGELMARFDTIVMGRRSFEAAGGGAMPGVKSVVISRTLRQEDYSKVTVLGEDFAGTISQMKAEPGKDIWLWGGGSLLRSMLDARLVDAVEVGVIPVLLGDGVPLLPPPGGRVKLRLTGHKVYSKTGSVGLDYAVEYESAKPRKSRRSKV